MLSPSPDLSDPHTPSPPCTSIAAATPSPAATAAAYTTIVIPSTQTPSSPCNYPHHHSHLSGCHTFTPRSLIVIISSPTSPPPQSSRYNHHDHATAVTDSKRAFGRYCHRQ
ncbi:hypothetical protein Tco_0075402, partial [Tanacetum coccineum]